MLRALLAEDAPGRAGHRAGWSARRDQGARRLGLGAAPGRGGDPAVPDPARADRPASAGGSPRSAGCPTSARSATPATGPGPRRHNSAQRLGSLWRALRRARRRSATRLRAACDGPVLLGRRPDRHRLDDDGRGPRCSATRAPRPCCPWRSPSPRGRTVTALGDVAARRRLADHRAARDGPAGHAVGHVDGRSARRPPAPGRRRPTGCRTRQITYTSRSCGSLRRPARRGRRAGRAPRRGVPRRPLVVFAHVEQVHPGRQVRRETRDWSTDWIHLGLLCGSASGPAVAGASLLYLPPQHGPCRGQRHRPAGGKGAG